MVALTEQVLHSLKAVECSGCVLLGFLLFIETLTTLDQFALCIMMVKAIIIIVFRNTVCDSI